MAAKEDRLRRATAKARRVPTEDLGDEQPELAVSDDCDRIARLNELLLSDAEGSGERLGECRILRRHAIRYHV